MLMFILGFLCAWFVLAVFAYFADNGKTGICLFDGWGTTVLMLPLYPIALPVSWVYEKIKQRKNRED